MASALPPPPVDTSGTAAKPRATSVGRLRRLWLQVDLWWALALASVTYITLRISSPAVGFVRDEGYYFKAAEQYFGWYRALWRNLWSGQLLETFGDATILRYFDYNTEHPALIKTLMGFTWWWTHEVLGLSSNAEGFRVIGPLFAALCVAATFALGRRAGLARPYAAFAGLAWWLMPHNYFYSHLACFDVPVTAMTVLVVYAYLRGRDSLGGALLAALAFGLACATKHNALFLGPLLLGHYVITRWREFRWVGEPGGALRLPPLPLVFPFMALAAPLVMYLHWPYLWHHPLQRFGGYLAFHLKHEHYPISFGDQLLLTPPFPVRFPFVMTAYTMPALTLVLALLGAALLLRPTWQELRRPAPAEPDGPGSHALMWGIMALFPVALIAMPSVPIFGGIKHWMPSTPFLALFAAWALQRAGQALSEAAPLWPRALGPAALALVALLPSLAGTVSTHPYGMSYYNELAGGVRGGAQKNLQRTFWGHSDRRLIERQLNQVPDGSRVFFNRTNYDSVRMYQRDNLLKRGVMNAADVAHSDYAFVFYQGGYLEELYKVWDSYGTRTPVATVSLRGVPLVSLFARPGKPVPPIPAAD